MGASGLGMAGLVVVLAASQALNAGFQLLRAKSVAITLGPAGMGTVSLIDQLVYVVAFVASFALPQASVKYLSGASSQGPGAFARLYTLFAQTLLAASLIITVLVSGATLVWPGLWGPDLAPRAGLLALALLMAPSMGLHGLLLNVFAALQRPRLASLGRLGAIALMALGGVAGLLLAGLPGLYAGGLAGSIAAAVLLLGYGRRAFGLPWPWTGRPDWGAWRQRRDVLAFCGITGLIAVGEPLALLLVRYALLESADLAELGLFQSLSGVTMYLGLLLGQATHFYLTPLVNRAAPPGEKAERALEFQRQLALYVTVVALPLALFPGLVITLLYSDAFLPAAPYLALFVVAQAVLVAAGPLQALLIGLDDLRMHLALSLGAQATLATLAWLLAPAYGLWGVAVACLAAPAGLFLACLARLLSHHQVRLSARSAAVLAYSLALLAVAGWLGQGSIAGAGSVVARLAYYVAGGAVLVLFLTADERRTLGQQLSIAGQQIVAVGPRRPPLANPARPTADRQPPTADR